LDDTFARGALPVLIRIAEALERLAPPPAAPPDFSEAILFHYDAKTALSYAAPGFELPLDLLLGIDRQKERMVENLRRFIAGAPFNNVLLWGARGTGKSSLVKSAVTTLASDQPSLKLLEIDRDAVNTLPHVFATLRNCSQRFVVMCDDLSFEEGAGAAKSLKSALEGGVSGPPRNVMFVATSNRRHLMPRSHEDADMLAAAEDAEETISASDRFGLWLGFPPMDQSDPALERRALQWAQLRGGRSGRTAFQFIRDLAGEQGRDLPI
jgi:predicted AAA+ superfamily ATPase